MNEKFNFKKLLELKEGFLTSIEEFNEKLNNGKIIEDRIDVVKRVQIVKYVNLFNTLYCTKADNEVLKNKLEDLLTRLSDYWIKEKVKIYHTRKRIELDQYSLDAYEQMLTIISLCILFDVSREKFSVIVHLIDRDNVKDFLYENLIKYYYPERKEVTEESYSKFFAIPNMNKKIIKILNDENQEDICDKLKSYLDKDWYKSHKDCYWYNSHKRYPDSFYGYWAFEVAAIVKIKGLDDSTFRDNKYYPDRLL